MQGIEYIYELCEALPRSGPGDNASTRRAFNAVPEFDESPLILDIGCGQGMQTIELAKIAKGKIIALDNHQGFLDLLMEKAKKEAVDQIIIPLNQSMLDMTFDDASFDLIWAEGALYIMGFAKGLKRCHQLLKQHGCLAMTELVYTRPDPPAAVTQYLEQEYPDISGIEDRMKQIGNNGYRLITHFTLPESAWMDNYYLQMEKQLPLLHKKYQGNQLALSVFESFRAEIAFYRQYSNYFGYQFFVMQKDG